MQYSPIGFDVSAQEIVTALSSGSTLALIDEERRRDSIKLIENIETEQIDHLFAPYVVLMNLSESRNVVHQSGWPKEIFTAAKNEGAYLNGKRIRCTVKEHLNEMVMLNSRSEKNRGLWEPYDGVFGELRPVGSVAYKLGLTAAGQADIFASLQPKNEWDICAGHCIINESGGVLFDLHGKSIKYNQKNTLIHPGLIAGSKNKVDSLLKIINI